MIEIIEGSLPDALQVLGKLPEFDPLLSTEHYLERVKNKQQLTLLAKVNGELAGCKVAYNRDNDGMLYSWLGGVAPQHRKKGPGQAHGRLSGKLGVEKWLQGH